MHKLIVALFLSISLAGFSQIPDTAGIVTWKLVKRHRVKKQMTITIEGKIRFGYYIPPPERLQLGIWQNNKTTNIYFTADSNWIVNTADEEGGIIGKPNKYKLSISYHKDTVAREQMTIVPIDTTIDGQKKYTGRYDTLSVTHTEVEYIADCRVTGEILMRRTIILSASEKAKKRARQELKPAPAYYAESEKERKKRIKKGMKAVKEFRVPFPDYIYAHITYENVGQLRIYTMKIPFLKKE